jgi:hypothetical protein
MSGKTVPIDIPNYTLILFKGRVDPLLDCMKCQGGSRCKAAPTRRRGARPEIYNSQSMVQCAALSSGNSTTCLNLHLTNSDNWSSAACVTIPVIALQ